MEKTRNKLEFLELLAPWAVFFSIIASLSPFLFLGMFNHPSADNFCYTNVFNDPDIDGVLEGVMDWRRRWNGRYFSLFLIGSWFVNLDMIKTYHYVPYLLFSSWLFSAYYLLRSFLGPTYRFFYVAICAFALCGLYTLTMPLVSNGFYHVTGAFQYQTGNILTMLLIGCLVRISSTRNLFSIVVLAALLIFAVVGSTELHMASILILITIVTFQSFITTASSKYYWFFLLVVTLLSVLLLISAPGNEGRGQHYLDRHQFWFSVGESIKQLSIWLSIWYRDPLFWLVTGTTVLWLKKFTYQNGLYRRMHYLHVAIFFPGWLLCLFSCFFVAFWSMGVGPPERAMNVVYFIFLIGWFFLVFAGINVWYQTNSLRSAKRGGVVSRIATLALLVLMSFGFLSADGFLTAYADLFHRAQKYDELFQARYRQIDSTQSTETGLKIVRVPEIPDEYRPSSIMVDDIRNDHRNFRNECYATYFKLPGIETVRTRFWARSNPVMLTTNENTLLPLYANYVIHYPELRSTWETSGKNIEKWGENHWNSVGRKEGRRPIQDKSKQTILLTLQKQRNKTVDQVSCSVKGFFSDGRPDLLFTLDTKIPADETHIKAITKINLERRMPNGVYQTGATNYVLGISTEPNAPIINNPDGTLRVSVSTKDKRLWLHACADGQDSTDSIYFAEAEFLRLFELDSNP